MELDELKESWKKMESLLAAQERRELRRERDAQVGGVRRSLRKLYLTQVAQLALGVASMVLAAPVWVANLANPPLLFAGLAVHVYGIIAVVCGGLMIQRIRKTDYAAPVLEIQRSLLSVTRQYIVTGLVVGMPWWFMWVPYSQVVMARLGVDLGAYDTGPWVQWSWGFGVAAALLTLGLIWWSTRPARAARAGRTWALLAGHNLNEARRRLQSLEAFQAA